MADENTTPPKISEISIGGKTYEIVDLQMRRAFMKYYDKLHGPYANMHGVLIPPDTGNKTKSFTLTGNYIPENTLFLAYLLSNNVGGNSADDDAYDVAMIYKSNKVLHKVQLAGKNNSWATNPGVGIAISGDSDDAANFGFYVHEVSAIFGFIRLSNYNYNDPTESSHLGNRKDTWALFTGSVGGKADSGLELK